MDDQELARQFALYRDHGKAEALVKVFDRLAPGLLKLACHLTRDRFLSEDLLQATFLTAMEKASAFDDSRPLRPWLNGILILHVRKHHTKSACTLDGDRFEQPKVREPSEIVERRELEQEVERALHDLPEYYREVIISRFKLGLPNEEIARNTGRSPGVVRMQVHRGLKRLRRALPPSLLTAWFGFFWSRKALASVRARILARAMVPFTVPSTAVVVAGGVIMSKKLVMAVAGACLLVGASILLIWEDAESEDPSMINTSKVPVGTPVATAAVDELQGPEKGERERIFPEEESAAPHASSMQTGRMGRVLDPRGRPVSGVALTIQEPVEQTVESDAQGRFELTAAGLDVDIVVSSPYVPVRRGLTNEGDELLLVVAPKISVSGTVVDESGEVLPNALIKVHPVPLNDFPVIIDRTRRVEIEDSAVQADDQGHFELSMLPLDCAVLQVEKPGYETLISPVNREITGIRLFTLRTLNVRKHVLTGTVLDHFSRVVPDAFVAFNEKNRSRTDEYGFFRIEYQENEVPVEGACLMAAKRGYQTRVIRGFHPKGHEDQHPCHVEIRLVGPTLEISGRLIDAAGKPIGGAFILLWGEEPLIDESTAEDLSATGEVVPLEESPQGLQASPDPCRTDEQGLFRLQGLSDRSYRLRIVDFEVGFAMTTHPIRAGSRNVFIRLSDDAFQEKLVGRVLNRKGEPLSNVKVIVSMWVARHSRRSSLRTLGSTFTDEDGNFELRRVCRLDTVRVRAMGEGILDQSRYLEPDDPAEGIILVVEERCHFRIELHDPASSHSFRILDGLGEPLIIHHFGAMDGDRGYKIAPLNDGKSPVLSVSDRACMLELLGEMKRSVPIRLYPGEITVLRR